MSRGAKFNSKLGSRKTTKLKKSGCPRHYFGCPRHYFGCPDFVTLLYVCGTSSHTAAFVGKRKIT